MTIRLMLHNLHVKIFAFLLAIALWFFVVSVESRFFIVPGELPVEVFNMASDSALSSALPKVRVVVNAADQGSVRGLEVQDFEAYIDVRDVGVGRHMLPVSVTPKQAQVSVVRVEPSEIEVVLEPVRTKSVKLFARAQGQPAKGFRVQEVAVTPAAVTARGAESILKTIVRAEVVLTLHGNERESFISEVGAFLFFDAAGMALEGVTAAETGSTVKVTLLEEAATKEVGVKAKITGAVSNGVVERVTVEPALISITGPADILARLDTLETEPIDLAGASESFEKIVGVIVPEGVTVGEGETRKVKVAITIK